MVYGSVMIKDGVGSLEIRVMEKGGRYGGTHLSYLAGSPVTDHRDTFRAQTFGYGTWNQ